jgi:hypothetical protein
MLHVQEQHTEYSMVWNLSNMGRNLEEDTFICLHIQVSLVAKAQILCSHLVYKGHHLVDRTRVALVYIVLLQ